MQIEKNAFMVLFPTLLRQADQQLGHAAREVEEDEVRCVLEHSTQQASQRFEESLPDLRMTLESGGKSRARQEDQRRWLDNRCRSRTRSSINQREFPESVPGVESGEDDLISVFGRDEHLDQPLTDDVERFARVPLVEDDLAFLERPGVGGFGDSTEWFIRKPPEQAGPPEYRHPLFDPHTTRIRTPWRGLRAGSFDERVRPSDQVRIHQARRQNGHCPFVGFSI